jgi:urease gamma subunit
MAQQVNIGQSFTQSGVRFTWEEIEAHLEATQGEEIVDDGSIEAMFQQFDALVAKSDYLNDEELIDDGSIEAMFQQFDALVANSDYLND